ncbi:MAG: ATP synthase F1 subunit delta [Clostridia bacterium]
MNERVVLYSSSLYDCANEENCTKDVYDSLKVVEKVLEENKEYVSLMSSAALTGEERVALLEKAFSGQIHDYAMNFLKILAKKRIFDIAIPCIKEYEKQYLKDNNIENATIVTAIPLSEEKQKEIIRKISMSSQKTVNAKFEVREDIIGGIIIETDNSGIDASVKSKLLSIERHISKN